MQNVNRKSRCLVFLFLFVLLLVICFISICLGRFGFINIFSLNEQAKTVMFNIRLPRVLIACIAGASLSVAGTSFQTLFHNPLASPDILGASSGAGFGASLAILLGFSKVFVTMSAFVISLFSIILVYLISYKAYGKRNFILIISGVLVSALFSSGISFIKFVADPENKLPEITYWLMGSLSRVKKDDLLFVFLCFSIGVIPLFLLRWKINFLSLSTDEAKSLGINTVLLKGIVIACATLLTSASVSVAGLVGWIGIIVPQISRHIIGEDNRFLIPFSAIFGASFLVIIDSISRCAFSAEIPISILMTFTGTPLFVIFLIRRNNFEYKR